ncbi:mannosyltransferase [Candidatus Nanopelagicus limnes]|uniref:Polyprenol-phosphate-mannose--protein mannosyltransferase n=1 Tax=Candidatus Nanopelagicus limnae TaxID=1884634 RepID=A0A249JZ44_9ACTN|nr:phospholipid carrier-dependent glycosyltransferase [Candidatus Nanopelagicus limnes]ASY09780.1 mannosyltransferase [Candidatus Nanopelagicus limnes]
MSITRFRHLAPISIIIGFALSLRLWRLNLPKGYIFDEVYYAKNAASLITDGVELNEQGESEFVVHPPFGKWLIGIGIKLFGNNEFGWRVIAAVIGSASVLLIYLIVQRLFSSLFLSNIAAALFALDGLHLVMSRVALLDIFLMFFILLTFYLILRNDLWLSGVVIGLAAATKWSAVFVIPFLILLTVNIGGANFATWGKRFSQFVLTPLGIYLLSWSGWIISSKGWARDSGSNFFSSLWNYHVEIMNFHRGLTEQHTYAANPWSWLVLGRPTSFYYETPKNCGAQSCSQEILAIGTPILWWAGIFAIAITVGLFIANKDRVSAFILAGIAGTYLPWFFIQNRTTFYFYAIAIFPFIVLALINVFNWALNNQINRKLIYGFVITVGVNFIYFLPIFIGINIPYVDWLARMWLPSWI